MNNYRIKILKKLEINSLILNVKYNIRMFVRMKMIKKNFLKKKVLINL